MQFFSYFYFSLTDCIFTVFYKLLLPFSAYAGRLRRSNCRFLLNSIKYKKLEEKPRPRGYNRIIKRKPNSNGERSVHYVIHYHFYCSHLRKYVLHAARAAVWTDGSLRIRLPLISLISHTSPFHRRSRPLSRLRHSSICCRQTTVWPTRGTDRRPFQSRTKVPLYGRNFLPPEVKKEWCMLPLFWHLQNKCY